MMMSMLSDSVVIPSNAIRPERGAEREARSTYTAGNAC